MKRRWFLGAFAALMAGSAVAKPIAGKLESKARIVAWPDGLAVSYRPDIPLEQQFSGDYLTTAKSVILDESVTCMAEFKGRLFVAHGRTIDVIG